MTALLGRMLSGVVPWRMRRLEFSEQLDEAARENSRTIIEIFLIAARAGLREESAEALMALEAAQPWFRRQFFWEGHAFGVAALHACAHSRGAPEPRYHAPGFRFMFFTGVGFWNGVAGRSRLPQVSLAEERWGDVADKVGCRPLLAGGVSFGAVSELGRLDRALLESLGAQGDRWWRRGVYQGAGRAAWFLYMRNMARLNQMFADIEGWGEDAVSVAEGLGLAITYTQLGEPERILPCLEALPEALQAPLRRGARLCLAAAVSDDPRIEPHIAAMPDPLVGWFEEGRAALAEAGRGAEMPERLVTALSRLDLAN